MHRKTTNNNKKHTHKMEKGTENYKKAQEIANKLQNYAGTQRWSQHSFFEIAYNEVGRFIAKLMEIDGFASQVAATIDKTMSPYGYAVARVSSKQAWILACAAVEKGIEF